MVYMLETLGEAERLERQALQDGYSLDSEFSDLGLSRGDRVLDAGCGSGVVARHLALRFPGSRIEGCDLSAIRIRQARELCVERGLNDVRFFESTLEAIQSPEQSYDVLVCRYVMEHLSDRLRVAREFLRVLKPAGRVVVVDFDGLLFNLHHSNPRLEEYLGLLRVGLKADLFIGRKLPSILMESGFRDVEWRIEAISFSGDSLKAERDLTQERLAFAFPHLAKILGSGERASEFVTLYLAEMLRPGNTLFYNKFVVMGRR